MVGMKKPEIITGIPGRVVVTISRFSKDRHLMRKPSTGNSKDRKNCCLFPSHLTFPSFIQHCVLEAPRERRGRGVWVGDRGFEP